MNTYTLLRFGFVLFICQLAARLQGEPAIAGQDVGQIIERGADYRIVQAAADARYTELETGMHFWDAQANRWSESSVDIVVGENGASATHGQHQAYFSGNLADTPSVTWVTPQGKQWKSRVLGISYYNRVTHQSVWIAELKPEVAGVLHPPNRVIYPDAFDSISGEVHFVYEKAKFSATILLLSRPPSPSDFQLDPDTCSLEVVTEIFDLPALEKQTKQLLVREDQPLFSDDSLNFGDARIGKGQAFLFDDEAAGAIPVCKTLARIEGRDLLFESVDYISAKPYLDTLPELAGIIKPVNVAKSGRIAPQTKKSVAQAKPKPLQVASARPHRAGFAVDWEGAITGNTNDYVFAPNTTTYVSGYATLSGSSNYLMGGTVIKFAPTNTAQLNISGTLVCQTSPYEMAVLTARDDHSVGTPIGSASLSGYYATAALSFVGDNPRDLSYVRIAYANKAIYFDLDSQNTLSHCQIMNCGRGLDLNRTTTFVRNCLMYRVQTNFTRPSTYSSDARCEHLTVVLTGRSCAQNLVG